MQPSDAELVEAACAGDASAFGELYERHFRMAAGVAFSRLSDCHLAEDAAQDAMAVACRTLATLKDKSRFAAWLGTIARRSANRLAKTRMKTKSVERECRGKHVSAGAASNSAVRDAIDRLDATSREIVLLHYFSEMSHEEIAQVLEMSAAAIHGRLQRARRKLADDLMDDQAQGAKNDTAAGK